MIDYTKRLPHKMVLGKDYIIYYNNSNVKYRCRFIQPTKNGFNLLNLETNKCILDKHVYPSKKNHKTGDWFWFNHQLNIQQIK